MFFGCCPLLGKEYVQLLIGCGSSVSLHSGFYNPQFVYTIGTFSWKSKNRNTRELSITTEGFPQVAK
jgi:hypothetical protein